MFPIAPILIVAAMALRNARAGNKPRQGAPVRPAVYRVPPIIQPVWVWLFIVPGILTIPLVFPTTYTYYGTSQVVLWAFAFPFLWPWFFVRRVLVPLGMKRAAFRLTRWSGVVWAGDQQAGPAVAGAWALLRAPAHDPEFDVKLSNRIAERPPLMGGGILASGLLAASRGDLDSARRLIRSAGTLHKKATPVVVRRLATEWLVIDGTECGDWRAVLEASRRSGPHTPLARLLENAAAIRTGQPARFATIRVMFWWVLSGRWTTGWPILRQAFAGPPARRLPGGPAANLDDPLALALAFHTRLMETPPCDVTAERLVATGLAWDAVFGDASLAVRLAKRAVTLACPSANDPVGQLRESTISDLVALLADAGLPFEQWRGASRLLDAVAERLRGQMLSQLEEMCARLRSRVQTKKALPPIDEWREYVEVRRTCDDAAERGGLEVRRLAFAQVHSPVCSLAVWLYNSRQEKAIAHAMFAWLAQEATAVGDQAAITLQTKNAGFGPGL